MANNYTEGSAVLEFPKGKQDVVKEIVRQFEEELEAEDECLCGEYYVGESSIHICHDENVDADQAATVVERIQEALQLDEPFCMQFAWTCSKARPDEFGGCSFYAKRGQPTLWLSTNMLLQEDFRNVLMAYQSREV